MDFFVGGREGSISLGRASFFDERGHPMGEGGIYFDGGRGLKKNMKCAHPSIHPLEETLFMTYGYYFNDFLQILNGPKHKTACCLLSNYISLP